MFDVSPSHAMGPKLLIIQPSYYRAKTDRTIYRVRRRQVMPLTPCYLAALTPSDWEVSLVDEQLQPIDFDCRPDLVTITSWTLNSLRAYDIADEFRRRDVPVVIGGPHTCFNAEEVAAHCSVVGIGEAESYWTQMLADARGGCLRPTYQSEQPIALAGLALPRYDLLDLRRYGPFRTGVVVSSRGCPFRCEFCSERFLLGEEYRFRPVAEVVEEIKRCPSRNILFGDSNFAGKLSHTMELMAALVPLKVRWSALWPSHVCADTEFLDLAVRSGVLHVNIGLESIDAGTLSQMNKRFNKVDRYAELLANLRRRGISYSLNFVFGWEDESEKALPATLAFLFRHKVPAAYFNILTPVKGTPLYDRMKSQDRILNPEDIDRWPGQLCYIKPPYGTPRKFEGMVQQMYRSFYSLPSMFARLPMPITKSNVASWVINFSQRRMARAQDSGNNFDGF
jgi:radical SAM superfamily enzyme YgiQ (UPF0313 family)